MTKLIKRKLKKSNGQTNFDKYRVADIEYYRISHQSKNFIHYIIKKLKNKILNTDILMFFDLNIEMLCLLQLNYSAEESLF